MHAIIYDYMLLKDAKNVMKAQILMVKYHQINFVVIPVMVSTATPGVYKHTYTIYKSPLFGLY